MAQINRRQFLTTTAAAGAATFVPPRFNILAAGDSPNEKPNIAMVGNGGIASMAYRGLKAGGEHKIVAVCDADRKQHKKHKNAFVDFRKMYDKMHKEIDGVCINTPDHTHFAATIIAMQLGIHVITQKPLTHDIWQARTLLKAAAKYPGVITSMANQGHTRNGIRDMKEMYEADILGQVREVHSGYSGPNWRSRYFCRPSEMPMPKQEVPGNLDWDMWIGPAVRADYNRNYHPAQWRSFWNYGTGMLGDWFCHIGDGPVWVLDLYDPTTIKRIVCDENLEGVIPNSCTVEWMFPERGDKIPCKLIWKDGMGNGGPGLDKPSDWTHGRHANQGSYWYGTKNNAYLDERSDKPRISKREEERSWREKMKNGDIAKKYPRVPEGCNDNPHGEWLKAIKGQLSKGQDKPGSCFEYAARLTETCLLGAMAERVGGTIEWDAKNLKITNRPELNALVKEPVQNGWEDYGKDLW